jgi:hypothetical protein
MIVERQRSNAVQDLIEEILGMDLLHDLAVDPITHAKEPLAVDAVDCRRQDGGNSRHQPPILAIEILAGGDQGNRAPRALAPPH